MAKRFLMLTLVLASFAAVAPAAVVYGRGYGYARPGVRVGVYAAPRYYYGPRVYAAPVVPYVAPVYPAMRLRIMATDTAIVDTRHVIMAADIIAVVTLADTVGRLI